MNKWNVMVVLGLVAMPAIWTLWGYTPFKESIVEALEPSRRQVVIEEVQNGYTVSECVVRTPCGVTRVAPDAQGATALAWQYLTGPAIRAPWWKLE